MIELAAIALIAATAIVAFCRWAFLPRHHLPRNRVRDLRLRLRLRLHPGRGHATVLELWLRWGRLASFRESKRTRPDLTNPLYRVTHPDAHSVHIGRAQFRHGIRADIQNGGAVIGPPRSGKTRLLSRMAMAAPGALLITSSKPDIFALTSGLRSQRGPVWVFNPQGLGGIPSNVRWNPLAECEAPEVAIRRADSFASAAGTGGTDDAAFWAGKASDGLRGFFSAAALRRDDVRRVGAWVGGQDVHQAIEVLHANGRQDWAGQLANDLTGEAAKTASTIRMVMSRAMSWLLNPELAAACLPGPGQQFDIDQFLLTGGTLYMLARTDTDDCILAPLFACLAAEIHERALQLGALMKGGRLQPNLTMILDEVCRIAPVPLPAWGADSAGQGVLIWSGFQSIAQLKARWGEHGAQTVLDTSTVKIITPGVTDPQMLEHLSRLCGKASYRQHKAEESWQFTEIMDESMIRQLPDRFALIIRSNCAVVIARLAAGWNFRPYKKAKRRHTDVAAVTATLPAAALPPHTIPGVVLDGEHEALTPAPRRPWRDQPEGGQA